MKKSASFFLTFTTKMGNMRCNLMQHIRSYIKAMNDFVLGFSQAVTSKSGTTHINGSFPLLFGVLIIKISLPFINGAQCVATKSI